MNVYIDTIHTYIIIVLMSNLKKRKKDVSKFGFLTFFLYLCKCKNDTYSILGYFEQTESLDSSLADKRTINF